MVELVRLYSNQHSEAMRLCRLYRAAQPHYRSTAELAAPFAAGLSAERLNWLV
jgi:hypothetical protein